MTCFLHVHLPLIPYHQGNQVGLGTYDELADSGMDLTTLVKQEDSKEDIQSFTATDYISSYPHSDITIDNEKTMLETSAIVGNVCYKYGSRLTALNRELSKSLDTDYLAVLGDMPQMSQSLLSKSGEWLHPDDVLDDSKLMTAKKQPKLSKKQDFSLRNGTHMKSLDNLSQNAGSILSLESLDPDIKVQLFY